jgi:DNA-binding IclR family transcriptional regulator
MTDTPGTPQIAALHRTLAMLEAIIADNGGRSIAALARDIGVPVATAHRQVATLTAAGYLARSATGRHLAGPRLLRLAHLLDEKQVIAHAAATVLHRLAAKVGSIVQLGTLENDMVTYRLKTGRGAQDLFTRTGLQLEAYCSGIGKVLLAHLPPAEQQAYLAAGPFVALTPRTITDPARLATTLIEVRERGYASDDGEIAEDLACLAVPIHAPDGRVPAAISVSRLTGRTRTPPADRILPLLRAAATDIEMLAFGPASRP